MKRLTIKHVISLDQDFEQMPGIGVVALYA